MPKTSLQDDDIFEGSLTIEKPKVKRGHQEDGTYITSSGAVLPAKNRNRREAYPEPEEKQVPGNEEIVEHPEGHLSFLAVRMTPVEFRRAGFLERKRQKCLYRTIEVYAGKPRPLYSYDEIVQLRKGELVR